MHTPGPWFAFDASELAGDEPGKRAFFVGLREFCTIAYVRAGSDEALVTGDIEANARLIAAAPDLANVARAYEQWEADLIYSQEAWGGGFRSLPVLTQELWDRLLEIQAMRNAALSKLSQQQGSDATGSPQAEGVKD